MTETKLTDDEVKAIIQEAEAEAGRFVRAYIEQHGQHYPCGFAWVNIKPATGQFVKVMKQLGLGAKSEVGSGYTIWNPSHNYTQCMDAKLEGARVFAEALRKHGLKITVHSRMD